MTDAPSPPDGSANSAGPAERFSLRVPPTFGPRFFMAIGLAVGFVVVVFAQPLLENGDGLALLGLLVVAAVVPGALALAAAGPHRNTPASIELLDDRLLLPDGEGGRFPVRFRNLRVLVLQRRRLTGFFFIGTDEREIMFPLRVFPGDEAERLLRAIRSRMSATEDGERRLAAIDRLARVADRAFGRNPVVTWAVVGVMAAIHAFLVATGQLIGVLDVASLGAVSPELVAAADPYLAFTAHWIHGWRFQPLLVLPGVLILGTLVERLLGHGVAAFSILGSATVGGLVAAYYPGAPLHAGALIPAAGLVGTLAFCVQRYRGRMPVGFRLNGQWWAWLGMLAIIAVTVHGVSVPGVLFGLLTGVLVGAATLDREPELPLAFSPRWSAIGATVLLVLHVGAAGWAIEGLRDRGLQLEQIAVENLSNAPRLNQYAWTLAVDPQTPPDRLELALIASDRAAGLEDRAPHRPAALDTKATVLHRLGRSEEAIGLELSVLDERPDLEMFATQLARFIRAADRAALPAERKLEGVSIRLRAEAEAAPPQGGLSPQKIVAEITTSREDKPRVAYAPVSNDQGEIVGLLRLPVPQTASSTSASVVLVDRRQIFEATGDWTVDDAYVVEGRASPKLWAANPAFLVYP